MHGHTFFVYFVRNILGKKFGFLRQLWQKSTLQFIPPCPEGRSLPVVVAAAAVCCRLLLQSRRRRRLHF